MSRQGQARSRSGSFYVRPSCPMSRSPSETSLKTLDYYVFGARRLESGVLSKLELGAVDSEQVSRFIHSLGHELSPSTVNQSLRTLRRALNIAVEWRKIPSAPKFSLLRERRREEVLEPDQEAAYLSAADEPWRTVATIWVELGMRPGEIIRLRTDDLDWQSLEIKVRAGKSDAARRTLFMTTPVYQALSAHCRDLAEGWIFPSPTDPSRHTGEKRIVEWHENALRRLFDGKLTDPAVKAAYIAQARQPWKTIFVLREEDRLRVADIVRLRHQDIKGRSIEVRRRNGQVRKIKLTTVALAALVEFLPPGRHKSMWVFPSSDLAKHVQSEGGPGLARPDPQADAWRLCALCHAPHGLDSPGEHRWRLLDHRRSVRRPQLDRCHSAIYSSAEERYPKGPRIEDWRADR